MKKLLAFSLLFVSVSGFAQDLPHKGRTDLIADPRVDTPRKPNVFKFVEQMPAPTFDVGTFLGENIHYPEVARKKNITGRVIIQFIVNEDGSISDLTPVTNLGYGLEEEAMRVIRLMPKWKPAKQNGKYVKVFFNQPIRFTLE